MVILLQIRESIRRFFTSYDSYCIAAGKFLAALIVFLLINKNIGYSEVLASPVIAVLVALFCSFLPPNFTVVAAAAVSLLHIYALSPEGMIIVGSAFLLMMLLYFRFSPKDTVFVLLTPVCFSLKIPFVIPVAAGLLGGPVSVFATACGTIAYYMLFYMSKSEVPAELTAAVAKSTTEGMLNRFRFIISGILGNRGMLVFIAAFSITILAVYLIRRLSVDHSWIIAIFSGTLLEILVLLAGELHFKTGISAGGVVAGSLLAALVGLVIMFFRFNVDYSRTERVQFEDDEYYYYVKAVPKNTVEPAAPRVKKIKGGSGKDLPEYHVRRSVTEDKEKKSSSVKKNTEKKTPEKRTSEKRVTEGPRERRSVEDRYRSDEARSSAAARMDREVAAKARENRQLRENKNRT